MSCSIAERVVCASGAGLELILICIRVRYRFLTVTRDVTPRAITKPPPLDPTLVGSESALPAVSLLHTSKKLEIPAGQKAAESGNRPARYV